MKAFADVDDLLAEDNAIAEVFIGKSRVIEFPGRRRASAEEFGPVKRTASIDGQIFSIGGKDQTINVHLRNGEKELKCVVSVKLARRVMVLRSRALTPLVFSRYPLPFSLSPELPPLPLAHTILPIEAPNLLP